MKVDNLENMFRGWFVGDFEPAALRSTDCEVGLKYYDCGAREAAHVHKVATELTLVVSGEVEMSGRRYGKGAIVTIEPGEATDFYAVTDAVTVVVKTPSVVGDKFPAD